MFKNVAFATAFSALAIGYFIYQPVPQDAEDRFAFQVANNMLSCAESLAMISEKIGINRWWVYKAATLSFTRSYTGVTVIQTKFAGVKAVLVIPEAHKKKKTPGPAIVFYHGGGWVCNSVDATMPALIAAAKETGFLVMAPSYRLSPEHPFPAPFEDCLNSTIKFMEKAAEFNVNPMKVALAGDSAGGNLAMAVNLQLINLRINNSNLKLPAMISLLYPVLQGSNFQLPSYQQNQNLVFFNNVIPKFFLAYIGLNTHMELANLISKNHHMDYSNDEVLEKLELVKEDIIPSRYKRQPFKSDQNNQLLKKMDTDMMLYITKMMLDERIAPLMTTDERLSKLPYTHIMVCEYDQLRDDGILLHERMKRLGMPITLQYLPKSMHGVLTFGATEKSSDHAKHISYMFAIWKNELEPPKIAL